MKVRPPLVSDARIMVGRDIVPATADAPQKVLRIQHSRRSRATSMLRSQREKSQAIDDKGLAIHSKSSCVPLAYLTANSTIGNRPSHPSTRTLTTVQRRIRE
eukprot:08591_1